MLRVLFWIAILAVGVVPRKMCKNARCGPESKYRVDSQQKVATIDELDEFILAAMQRNQVPGLSAIISAADTGVIWENYYGIRNNVGNLPVTNDTAFMLASISKTIVAVSVYHLIDNSNGMINIDVDIRNYLPPNTIQLPTGWNVTLRNLLDHRSGIVDSNALYDYYYVDRDPDLSLRDWFMSYLSPNGIESPNLFSNRNFAPRQGQFRYTNAGFGILGYLVEHISGMQFPDYTYTNVFAPLGVQATGLFTGRWYLFQLDRNFLAKPNDFGRWTNHFMFPDYPNGAFKTTAQALNRFVTMIRNGGVFQQPGGQAVQIISTSWVNLLLEAGFGGVSDYLGFSFTQEPNGRLLMGHEGGEEGTATTMQVWISHPRQLSVIVLCNGDSESYREWVPEVVMRQLFNVFG